MRLGRKGKYLVLTAHLHLYFITPLFKPLKVFDFGSNCFFNVYIFEAFIWAVCSVILLTVNTCLTEHLLELDIFLFTNVVFRLLTLQSNL